MASSGFTPRAIESMRPHIERLAGERVAAFAASRPPADLAAGLAAPLSTQVIGDLLGVTLGDRDRFHTLVETLGSVDPFTGDPDAATAAARAWADLTRYTAGLVAAKHNEPGDDLLSALTAVRDARDGRLSDDELIGMATTLVAAGHQTARNAISAGTIQLVTENLLPDLAAAPPERVDAIVDEVLRRLVGQIGEPFPRWAREDIEVEGAPVRTGDLVLVRLEAANHDPRHFTDPEGFIPGRPSTKAHVSFGRGPHHCLGASLARVELTAAFRALARRLPGLRLHGPVDGIEWVRGLTDAGPESVPVAW